MKISFNNNYNLQSSVNNQKKASDPSFESILRSKNKSCDQIIISSKAKQDTQDNFIKNLTNKISEEVKAPKSSDELESLKKQIEDGTYKIDIDEIVKKIMLN